MRNIDNEIKLQQIVQQSVKSVKNSVLQESYIVEPKTFKQVTNMLSQKSKDAHTELYNKYVKYLNEVSIQLDSAERYNTTSQSCTLKTLKNSESYNLNAKLLHELFFANCFDPNSEIYADSNAYMKLQRDFGSFDDWQMDFLTSAKTCGEGWVVCAYNTHLRRYINTVISLHSNDVMLCNYPVIVLDMWSHAYNRDYLNDVTGYTVAMMREFNWKVIEDRFTVAEKIAEVTK